MDSRLEVKLIDINLIKPNPWNCNAMNSEEFRSLLIGMSKIGEENLPPILCRRDEDGTYEIIDGEHRYKAAKVLGWRRIPVIVVKVDKEDVKVQSLILNYSKGRIDPLKLFDLLYKEWEGGEGRLSTRQIAEKYGRIFDQSWVVKILSLRRLSPKVRKFLELQRELNGGRIPLSLKHLIAIAKVEDEELQLKLAKAAIETKISAEGLEKAIASRRFIKAIKEANRERKREECVGESYIKCTECGKTYLVNWKRRKVYELRNMPGFTKLIEIPFFSCTDGGNIVS